MRITPKHPNFIMPVQMDADSGIYEIYMPESGTVSNQQAKPIGLGFSAEIPKGYVALVFPLPNVGKKYGIELNNTLSVIPHGHHKEWTVSLKTKGTTFHWEEEDRLLGFVIMPVGITELTEA